MSYILLFYILIIIHAFKIKNYANSRIKRKFISLFEEYQIVSLVVIVIFFFYNHEISKKWTLLKRITLSLDQNLGTNYHLSKPYHDIKNVKKKPPGISNKNMDD